jgi:hypothetical protein
MPKGKKKSEPKQNLVENVAISIVGCGHINKHYYNPDNELEDLACTLEKGHKGDHSNGVNFWSDAAGTLARKHAYEKTSGH